MLRILFCVFLLFFHLPAFAANSNVERVISFTSNITVNKDSTLDVTENIVVYSNGTLIKTGIERWLLLHYKDDKGNNHKLDYEVKKVLLNGQASPYRVEYHDTDLVIYVGESDVFLTPGIYSYSVIYKVKGAIDFLGVDGDELFWNVTGVNWKVPIERAEVTLHLPYRTHILRYAASNGVSVAQPRRNEAVFTENSVLQPGQALTIAATWPKGMVGMPLWYAHINANQFFIILIALVVFVYFMIILSIHGRSPGKGKIKPRFEPPMNLSPAAMRYILNMSFDVKAVTAVVVDMAVKGFMRIEYEPADYSLVRLNAGEERLAEEERAAGEELFREGKTLKLTPPAYTPVTEAKWALANNLKESYKDRYFVTNMMYLLPGLLLSISAFLTAIIYADNPANAGLAVVWLSVWTVICYFLLLKLFSSYLLARVDTNITNIFSSVFFTAFALPFLLGEVLGIYAFSIYIPIFTVPLLFLIVMIDIVFYHLLRTPTTEGRVVMDQIEGFRLFLASEGKLLGEPRISEEIFDRYLAYAIALDAEREWGAKFRQGMRERKENFRDEPGWYKGTNWNSGNMEGMPLLLSAGLGAAISAVSSAGGGKAG